MELFNQYLKALYKYCLISGLLIAGYLSLYFLGGLPDIAGGGSNTPDGVFLQSGSYRMVNLTWFLMAAYVFGLCFYFSCEIFEPYEPSEIGDMPFPCYVGLVSSIALFVSSYFLFHNWILPNYFATWTTQLDAQKTVTQIRSLTIASDSSGQISVLALWPFLKYAIYYTLIIWPSFLLIEAIRHYIRRPVVEQPVGC